MKASEPRSPRTFDVTADISAPRQPVLPQATPQAGPTDRAESRLARLEHRVDLIEGAMSTLTSALKGQR